jgi:periplasmic protein CpxP/Spy
MKKLTILTVLLFTVMGSIFAQKGKEVKIDPKERAEKMSQRLKTDLNLNEEQYAKLLALNTEKAVKREAQSKEMKSEMDAKRENAKAEREAYTKKLKSILTDEQYIKYLVAP